MVDPTAGLTPFLSGPPRVSLVRAFERPFEGAVAAARTCYSGGGVVAAEDVSGDDEPDPAKRASLRSRRDELARSIYRAGHHTTFQHAHFQFALANVSRQFIWTFLHSHPFYNSEQTSQRYVEVKPDAFAIPPLTGEALSIYRATVDRQLEDYRKLCTMLDGPCAAEYYRIWPQRRGGGHEGAVRKRSQEAARYVLPVSTAAQLYHTVSALTVLRYWRLARSFDAPLETQWVVGAMVAKILELDPLYETILEEPLEAELLPEFAFTTPGLAPAGSPAFREEFDRPLRGRRSLLVDHKRDNEGTVAGAVREVLGLTSAQLSDADALRAALDPTRNRLLGETLNLGAHSKLMRCLVHAAYTFKKRLSHAADSQDQRHRLTPASRPLLLAHIGADPDYQTPALVMGSDEASTAYRESMERTWEAFAAMRRAGATPEMAMYVLPNALTIRFTESADLLNLLHKLKSRLCYNAQEEIWHASVEEAVQVGQVNPAVGRFLLPPCGLRHLAGTVPTCPEGPRTCGIPVWSLAPDRWKRVI